jgi:hypothetical protein
MKCGGSFTEATKVGCDTGRVEYVDEWKNGMATAIPE